uniref:LysR family transcriptional regulator n=1 Tax=Steinernema glaseri TaxID=37863 RepID=A0A1I8AAF9_9BILA
KALRGAQSKMSLQSSGPDVRAYGAEAVQVPLEVVEGDVGGGDTVVGVSVSVSFASCWSKRRAIGLFAALATLLAPRTSEQL